MVAGREVLELLLIKDDWVSMQTIYNNMYDGQNINVRSAIRKALSRYLSQYQVKRREVFNQITKQKEVEYRITDNAKGWARKLGGSFIKDKAEEIRDSLYNKRRLFNE